MNSGFIAGIILLFLFYMLIPLLLASNHSLFAKLTSMPKAQMILLVCFPPPLLTLTAMWVIFKNNDRKKSLFEKFALNRWDIKNLWICLAVCVFMLIPGHVANVHVFQPFFLSDPACLFQLFHRRGRQVHQLE